MLTIPFPALSGDTITEGHVKVCRENGHATHTVDGVASDRCPRCGDLVRPVEPTFAEIAAVAATITDEELAAAYDLPTSYTDDHRGKYRRDLARRRLVAGR